MERYNLRIGIIGGGQLGKMMTQEAKKMGFYVTILDPTPNSPASQLADEQLVGDFHDRNKIRELVTRSDVTTYDIENIDVGALKELVEAGHVIHPSPQILEIIQDKWKQKKVLERSGIPIPRYKKVEGDALAAAVEGFGFPVVQKACRGGYDGRGVFVIRTRDDIGKALKVESFLEEFVEIEKELAVMVARSTTGEIKCYPLVEMVFDEAANICDMVVAPALVEQKIQDEARRIAVAVVEPLGGAGIFGIEMFLSKAGNVLVNEIAPRPHNSGHYTIEACVTSQFEQHIRAIMELPLGSTELLTPAVMINILGEEGHEGPAIFQGIREALLIPGASLHLYGKRVTRPFRKMGHVTVVDKDAENAFEKAQRIKTLLRVVSSDESRVKSQESRVGEGRGTPDSRLQTPDSRLQTRKMEARVGIIMGSESDLPVMEEAAQLLEEFGIGHELTIVSAHRTPERMFQYARQAEGKGIEVIIAGAGGAAHLPGMVASITPLPVIGVPIETTPLKGLDSLYSIVQMPAGVPVATVGINNGHNAAILAMQILGVKYPQIRGKVKEYKQRLQEKVEEMARRVEQRRRQEEA
ncbi:MAG: N5-carboxyaminoimidazole ribonucleotide mutase [Dehalococcoidia bacterium]|nr:N5-carboxyaminoimidazole ribonucleotide mutase [Chloroflexota bacterium]